MTQILSKYYFFHRVNDAVVGINLCNQTLFVIDTEKYDLLNAYKDNLQALHDINPAFHSVMQKFGVVTDAEADDSFFEKALLKRRNQIFGDPNYRMTVNPTLNCNFSCWYCYETHSRSMMSEEVMQRTIRCAERIIKRPDIRSFTLDWFGGEPLLGFDKIVKPVSSAIKKICAAENVEFQSGMTTNGYLINKSMIDFFRDVDMQSFQITLDGNRSIHDSIRFTHAKTGSFDKIVQNIILLAKELNPKNLCLRINFTHQSFQSLEEIADSFPPEVRPRIMVLLQQVWQDEDKNKFDSLHMGDLRKKFVSAGFQVDNKTLNYDGLHTCYADLMNQAVINYDGRVFKCTAMNFEEEKEEGVLQDDGDILWNHTFAHRIVYATFENVKCKTCHFLPVCYGPCSKKTSRVKSIEELKAYCFAPGIKEGLETLCKEFYYTKRPYANIAQFM